MRILAISGSLRRDSHNTALLRAAASLLPSGVEMTRYEGLAQIPLYSADIQDPWPAPVGELRDALAAADGILVSTPEYNSSIPGALKNALDWLSLPAGKSALRNVPAVVIGASTGMFGAVWAQAETRKVLAAAGARVVDRELPVAAAHEQFDSRGDLSDTDLKDQLVQSLEALADAIALRLEANLEAG